MIVVVLVGIPYMVLWYSLTADEEEDKFDQAHRWKKKTKKQFSCISQIYWPWISCYWSSEHIPVHQKLPSKVKTLPNAQRTQGIEYFESFNAFSSKQKLQQALKSWPNFGLVLFGKV